MSYEQLQVEPEDENIRIDKYINNKKQNLSRSYIQKLIHNQHIKVNGKQVKQNYKVRTNDLIDINIPEPEVIEILEEDIPLDIIYEDKDLLIVNKPQGMVVHPAKGNNSGTLVNALKKHCGDNLSFVNDKIRPGIVHRIDKNTSGLLLVAKNNETHISLARQIKEHSLNRKYIAIVSGDLQHNVGTINLPIRRHPIDRKKMSVIKKNGRNAVTHFKVLERFGQYTYIECTLETGRTHQIRVHMSYIGHSIIGDPLYGSGHNPFKLKGQALHAKLLGFIHPATKEYMEYEAAPPPSFEIVLNKLRG